MKTIPNLKETNLSTEAKERMSRNDLGALFLADWINTVFIHYAVEPEVLQRIVPFKLDVRDGKAYISLVAFTLNRMRFARAQTLGRLLLCPLSNHGFLNVRTYVREGNEIGIYFLAEWLNNRCAVPFGPRTFGLPYRFGHLDYAHGNAGTIRGEVRDADHALHLRYHADLPQNAALAPCTTGTLDEFLLERYTAFTHNGRRARLFRIWHEPWPQVPIRLTMEADALLTETWPFFNEAEFVGAHYSPGVRDVWMGFPHRLESMPAHHRLNTFFEMP